MFSELGEQSQSVAENDHSSTGERHLARWLAGDAALSALAFGNELSGPKTSQNRRPHQPGDPLSARSRIRAGVAGAVASNGSWHFVMNAALAVPSRHHMASHSSSGMSCSSGARTVGLSFFPRLRPAPDPSKGLVLQIAQFHRPREPLCPFAERLRTTDYGPLFRNHVMPPEATYCICPSQQPSLTSLTMTPSIKHARLPIRAHARSFLFY